VHKNDRLRRATDDLEKFELISERAAKQHLRRGEIPEDEFVALLGNFRRSSDIDDERYAFLFRNLGNGSGLARIECTNEDLRAITDELLGALARNIDIGLGVGVDDCRRRRWREGGGGLSKRGPAWRYPPIYPWQNARKWPRRGQV
jgi:hypothetical protein